MKNIITTKRPPIPSGFRKFKYCTGGYKKSILGKEVESEHPVWAERRTDSKALFAEDRVFYRLYTFLEN